MFNNKIQKEKKIRNNDANVEDVEDVDDTNMEDDKRIELDSVMDFLSYNVDQIGITNNNFVYLDDTNVSSYNQNLDKKVGVVKSKYRNIYCVNCGEKGHVVKDCFGPITSFGIIAFKMVRNKQEEMYDKNIRLQE
jgi:hypothetical protein